MVNGQREKQLKKSDKSDIRIGQWTKEMICSLFFMNF